ncbi:MAG: hypothetical protein V2B18_25175, partial [Pseudomonadota bacterium]
LSASLERMGNELVDLNLRFDEDAMVNFLDPGGNDGLQYLVGPYYGWRGGTRKCDVLVRLNQGAGGRWTAQGCAIKGSHPKGQDTRYLYQAAIYGGGDLPADVGQCGPNGTAQWNAYPTGAGGTNCYTESMIVPATGAFLAPAVKNCNNIASTD